MKVLVINCGSSSLKYQVLDMQNETLECKGLVERIGMDGSQITHEKTGMDKFILAVPMENHKDAIGHVLAAIQDEEHGVVKDMSEIGAVGHRIVHGGEKFACSTLLNEEVLIVVGVYYLSLLGLIVLVHLLPLRDGKCNYEPVGVI